MTKKTDAMPKIDVSTHSLVPKHTKMIKEEIKQLFETYNISFKDLPKISMRDPALGNMDVQAGDVIRIERSSRTAGVSFYYRGVINV